MLIFKESDLQGKKSLLSVDTTTPKTDIHSASFAGKNPDENPSFDEAVRNLGGF